MYLGQRVEWPRSGLLATKAAVWRPMYAVPAARRAPATATGTVTRSLRPRASRIRATAAGRRERASRARPGSRRAAHEARAGIPSQRAASVPALVRPPAVSRYRREATASRTPAARRRWGVGAREAETAASMEAARAVAMGCGRRWAV